MSVCLRKALLGASLVLIVCAMPAHADTPVAAKDASAAADSLEEIIVTARRKEEGLQTVPESVDAVTAQDIAKFNINKFDDVTKLVPGLTLNLVGYASSASLRGVTSGVGAAPPTLQQYVNDAPVDENILFASLYDVDQIEVLRGPQGTLRGKIAESGAITIRTRRPDLDEFGGYGEATVGNQRDQNIQGALNMPLVQDKLAIRVAALHDQNNSGGVTSLNNNALPIQTRDGGRITLEAAPTPSVDALVSYQHIFERQEFYGGSINGLGPYMGNGAPGGIVPGQKYPAPPAGYNGPPLNASAMETVEAGLTDDTTRYDDVESTLRWTVLGQTVTYVGGWARYGIDVDGDQDQGNSVPGLQVFIPTTTARTEASHDLRFSSAEPFFGHLDYVAGFFLDSVRTDIDSGLPPTYLAGAFGTPLAPPVLQAPNNRYALSGTYNLPQVNHERATYATLTFHLDDKTDLSAGIRYSKEDQTTQSQLALNPGFTAVALPAAFCAGAHGQYGVTYPGVCDIPVASPASVITNKGTWYPTIYNVELSRRFTPDFMAYFRTGTAWRYGAEAVGLVPFTGGDPRYNPYLVPPPEESHTYEFGFKGSLFDKRVSYDIDYYHQIYSGFFWSSPSVWVLNPSGAGSVRQASIVAGEDAKIDGVELSVLARLTNQWSLSGNFSLSDGRVAGDGPCNPPGYNSSTPPPVSVFTSANKVLFTCPISDVTARIPKWNANLSSEYDQPLKGEMQGFVRGLFNYYPSNEHTTTIGYTAPSYETLDLFLGVRNSDSAWEAAVYAKNVTNNRTITDINSSAVTSAASSLGNFFGPSGYSQVTIIPEREFGVTARYSFGSR